MKKVIIPAIIAKNQQELETSLQRVHRYVEIIQLDIMDGKFVQNTSLNFDFTLPTTSCHFEAHLMIEDPLTWITKYSSKVDTILVHYESCSHLDEVIDHVREQKKRVGLVLNPDTPLKKIESYLSSLDQVLLMTVHPGFYGSKFLPEILKKIAQLRQMKPSYNIEVDGGITDKTITLVDKAGANMFVSGSYIVKASNVQDSIETLRKLLAISDTK